MTNLTAPEQIAAFRRNMIMWLREPEQHRERMAQSCENMAKLCEKIHDDACAASNKIAELAYRYDVQDADSCMYFQLVKEVKDLAEIVSVYQKVDE